MATIRKTVTLTEQQDRWIKAQIEAGEFTNDSEYIRALIRQDQSNYQKYWVLKNELDKGLKSGEGTQNVPEIMKQVEKKMKTDGRL